MTDEEAAVIEAAWAVVQVVYTSDEGMPMADALATLDALHVAVLRLEKARREYKASR
jgi:hypothetical protein